MGDPCRVWSTCASGLAYAGGAQCSVAAMPLKQALAPLVDLVYPPRCPLCGSAVAEQRGLCAECWSGLVIPGDPSCVSCQRLFGEGGPAHGAICAVCLAEPPRHDGISAGTIYNEPPRKLVLSFKHGRKIALAPMLARLIARSAARTGGGVARSSGSAASYTVVAARLQSVGPACARTDETEPGKAAGGWPRLVQIDANARWAGAQRTGANPGGSDRGTAFPARNAERANILLVDDVMTSGATGEGCVRALKRAGAKRVRIACFARVLDEVL